MKNKEWCIIEFWEKIFDRLSKISIFNFIRKFIVKSNKHSFVDKWVFGNLVAAIISSAITYYLIDKFVGVLWIIITYASMRIFEVIIYQLNVFFFDQYRYERNGNDYSIKSSTRMVILLLHNYVEIMFWYVAIIISLIRINGGGIHDSWVSCVQSNIICIATFDSSGIREIIGGMNSNLGQVIFLEIITGIIMTLISLARFIGVMPQVKCENEIKRKFNKK